MSEGYPIGDPKFIGKNLRDYPALFQVQQYSVCEWTPQDNGQGKPEAVAIQFDLGQDMDGISFYIRLKSKKEVKRMQTLLGQYAAMVWPKAGT